MDSTPEQDPEATATTQRQPIADSDLLDLSSGEGYPLSGASEITSRNLTNIILFAGTAECGKTTLLASLYLMFNKQPFAGYIFAGSRTLVGFEKRVHTARIASRLSNPTTERSTVSELLHLRVRKEDRSAACKDLLLCDLIGEDFREARDSIDGCRRLHIIRRADAFVVLIDGAKVARLDARQQAKTDAIALLRNILDCEMLAETSQVEVLTTKWDLIDGASDRDECVAFNDHIREEMTRHFEKRVGLSFGSVAAHATQGTLPLGYGLEQRFGSWVERATGAARRFRSFPAERSDSMEYDRYLRRHLPSFGRAGS